MKTIDDAVLSRIEQRHAAGLTSAEILDVFATYDIALSEATLRKYVQLGLLPRSVRVGSKGKHRGSKGIYPVGVIRQILRIKQMMAENYTIEQIQREFLFLQSDLQQLRAVLGTVFGKIDDALKERRHEGCASSIAGQVSEAQSLGNDLLARLSAIETELTSRPTLERMVAS